MGQDRVLRCMFYCDRDPCPSLCRKINSPVNLSSFTLVHFFFPLFLHHLNWAFQHVDRWFMFFLLEWSVLFSFFFPFLSFFFLWWVQLKKKTSSTQTGGSEWLCFGRVCHPKTQLSKQNSCIPRLPWLRSAFCIILLLPYNNTASLCVIFRFPRFPSRKMADT